MHNALAAYSSPLLPDAGTFVLLVVLSLVPALVVYIWTALALSRVFDKLGVDGWKAWVPVYNTVVILGLGGLSGWLLLLWLIPVFGPIFVYVALIAALHRITVAFDHGAGMTVLAALLLPVWASILGFGSARPVHALATRPARGEPDDFGAFSAQFAPAGEDPFAARRDVPVPSAWIPPAPPAPETAAVPIAGAWGEPPAMPVAPPAEPAAPVAADPYAGVPAPPVDDPYVAPAPAPAPVAEPPAPVMSWWQPAIVEESAETPAPAPAATPSWAEPAAPEPAAASFVPPAAPPVLRESFVPETDVFPEASGEVSAVVGAPVAGAPLSAASSVAAARPGVGDVLEEDTVIASRRRPKWALRLPDGTAVDVTGDAVVLGRRPVPVHAAPGAQLVAVADETRTVSKTHALLRRRADVWMVSDLDSTNGVVVLAATGEIEVAPGAEQEVSEGFLLGDAELRIGRADG